MIRSAKVGRRIETRFVASQATSGDDRSVKRSCTLDDLGSTPHRIARGGPRTMLTATKDLMLPATVTGSWPRPRWYDGGLWGRPLDTALLDVRFREQFLDAHADRRRRPGARRARHPHQRRLPPRRGLRRPLVAPLPAAALEGPRARGAAVRTLARRAARVPARDADERDRDDVALAARRRQGRARPEEPARVREAVADRPGARGIGQARQVRDLLVAGAVDLPRQPHARVRPRRQEAADLGHGHAP